MQKKPEKPWFVPETHRGSFVGAWKMAGWQRGISKDEQFWHAVWKWLDLYGRRGESAEGYLGPIDQFNLKRWQRLNGLL